MKDIFDTLRAVTARVSNMHATTDFGQLTAEQLKTFMTLTGRLLHEAERALACGSAEINHRSRFEYGGAGLAKSEGYVNPQAFIAVLTGTSKGEARKIDQLGKSLMDASPAVFPNDTGSSPDPLAPSADDPGGVSHARPWFSVVTDGMLSGAITPDRCEALRVGLGEVTDTVTDAMLADAVTRLLDVFHPDDSPETVFRDARQLRATLDRAGVLENGKTLQAKQEAKVWTSRDGMVHLRADFAPEDGAWVKNTLDLILGPRIGGPRFAGPAGSNVAATAHSSTGKGSTDMGAGAGQDAPTGRTMGFGVASPSSADETTTDAATIAATRALTDDTRTTEQIRAAALVSLLKAGVDTDDNAVLARKRPAVQVIVTAAELTRPNSDGVAFIEGSRYPVSTRTVNRLICDTGLVPVITSSTGTPLDLGRTARLFTPTQRLALATLQGGCVWPTCDKPPSMCETHHINPWQHDGQTDILDGVLLCRHHHMQLHNYNWNITRTDQPDQHYEDSYWLVPPPATAQSTASYGDPGNEDTSRNSGNHGTSSNSGDHGNSSKPSMSSNLGKSGTSSFANQSGKSETPISAQRQPIKLRFRSTAHPPTHSHPAHQESTYLQPSLRRSSRGPSAAPASRKTTSRIDSVGPWAP